MTSRRTLTEAFIRNVAAAPPGKRIAYSDALVVGLRLRVTDTGHKSYILWRRFNRAAHPAARALGTVGAMTLTEARDKARTWIELIKAGQDPRGDATTGDNTFGAIVETYLRHHVAGQRQAAGVERLIRKELLPRWRNKSLATIDRRDVIQIIDEISGRGAPYQARNLLANVKVFFGWAIERGHVQTSPADRLKPSRLIGPASPRQRVLTDIELAAFWRAAQRMQYPIGPLFQLLLLTGQRRTKSPKRVGANSILPTELWVIPPERFKSDSSHLCHCRPM